MIIQKKEFIAFLENLKLEELRHIDSDYRQGVDCAVLCVNESIATRISLINSGDLFSFEESIASLIVVLENDVKQQDNSDFGKGFKDTVKPVISKLKEKIK